MGKTRRNPQLFPILGTQHDPDPLPESWRFRADIHRATSKNSPIVARTSYPSAIGAH